MKAWVGIDIAKDWFDACYLAESGKPKHKRFDNDAAGFAKLVRWVQSFGPAELHFCMESTGRYSDALAEWLVEGRQTVSVSNPARIRHHALSEGMLNKTDPVDARVIASYAKEKNPPPWRRSAAEVRALSALMRRLQTLQEHLLAETNRLGEPQPDPAVEASLRESIAFLQAQIETLRQQVKTHIDRHPGLKADQELLLSIPGIGETTAHWLLAELPDVQQFRSGPVAAAYAGLAPCRRESGKSVKLRTRLGKAGNVRLRAALYYPAVTAATHNPVIRAFYLRLLERGLCKAAAIGACMRKLLILAYGVLKTRTRFTAGPLKATT